MMIEGLPKWHKPVFPTWTSLGGTGFIQQTGSPYEGTEDETKIGPWGFLSPFRQKIMWKDPNFWIHRSYLLWYCLWRSMISWIIWCILEYRSDIATPTHSGGAELWTLTLWVGGTGRAGSYVYTIYTPSGKRFHNYGTSPFYSRVNQLFRLGHFQ